MNPRNFVFLLAVFLGLALLAPSANATSHYTVNEDDTVTDTATGLTWKRFAEGQTWDSTWGINTTNANIYTWDQAVAQQFSFWHLNLPDVAFVCRNATIG